MRSFDVRFWDIRARKGRRKPYEVRWVVGGHKKSSSFVTRGLADNFRAKLMRAARKGEAFDTGSGLPESMLKEQEAVSWYEHALAYIEMKWPRAAANTRRSAVEALVTVTPVLVSSSKGAPDAKVLRQALAGWAFNPPRWSEDQTEDTRTALRWLERASLPMSVFEDPTEFAKITRRVLDACAKTIDGGPAAATTTRRKRSVVYNTLGYAVERGLLSANPIDRVQWTAPEVAETVDRRVVASADQVRELLTAVSYVGRTRGPRLVAFFGLLYFAALRPSEAVALCDQDCELPEDGWGKLILSASEPQAGKAWTDDGKYRQKRGLKWRAKNAIRVVPIPPELVALLRAHIETYGVGEGGRLFRTSSGGPIGSSAYWLVWERARSLGLPPERVESPLAGRPYDLRHAGVSLWLNAGVPATEVARRAGHSVDVLLKIYASCIDGDERTANQRIDDALAA
jgi:integrase